MVTLKPSPQHKQFCITMEGSNLTALSPTTQTSLHFNGEDSDHHSSVIHSTNKFAFQWGRILTLTPFCHPQHKQVCIPMGEGSNPHTSLSAKVQISLNFDDVGVKVDSMKSKIFESTYIFITTVKTHFHATIITKYNNKCTLMKQKL